MYQYMNVTEKGSEILQNCVTQCIGYEQPLKEVSEPASLFTFPGMKETILYAIRSGHGRDTNWSQYLETTLATQNPVMNVTGILLENLKRPKCRYYGKMNKMKHILVHVQYYNCLHAKIKWAQIILDSKPQNRIW